MKGLSLKILWASLSLGLYLALCRWWAGQDRPPNAIYLCVVLWAALCAVTARLWDLRSAHVLIVTIGAAAFAAIWSLTLVDFPPQAVEHLPVLGAWLLLVGPIILTPFVGLIWPRNGPLLAALMMALADPALLPVRMWNSNVNVAGGWGEYPFPALPVEIILLVVSTALGLGGGYLGSRVRRRLVAARGLSSGSGCS
jgi:hypothetical protein